MILQPNNGGALANIPPGVSVLSLFRHLNYKAWCALAEFVDNPLQNSPDRLVHGQPPADTPRRLPDSTRLGGREAAVIGSRKPPHCAFRRAARHDN